MWIHYKHCWAHGFGDESYIEIPDDLAEYGYEDEDQEKNINDFLRDETSILKNNEWSDKYRGIEWFIIEVPPVKFIMQRIERHKRGLIHHEERLAHYQALLDKEGHITKEDFNV